MIVVRNTFIAKPGSAGKLVTTIKEALTASTTVSKFRILTDIVSDFNTVVLEIEAANLAEFEASMKDYATNEKFREKMKGYTDLWTTGKREIFQVVLKSNLANPRAAPLTHLRVADATQSPPAKCPR